MSKPIRDLLFEVEQTMGDTWLPEVYRRILKGRTRAYQFPPLSPKVNPQIQHTLLGIELKVARRRMLCPDLATARYLAVFVRVGARAVAIPYDITAISRLADALDSSWHRMFLIADNLTAGKSTAFRARLRGALIGKVRSEIGEAGAGPAVPDFNQNVKPSANRKIVKREGVN
jgi:hypothetical protein